MLLNKMQMVFSNPSGISHDGEKCMMNEAENADFKSYTAGRGYITIAMLMPSNANANAKQC